MPGLLLSYCFCEEKCYTLSRARVPTPPPHSPFHLSLTPVDFNEPPTVLFACEGFHGDSLPSDKDILHPSYRLLYLFLRKHHESLQRRE